MTVDKWQENDGVVSSISQRYPFTAGNHALGGEGFLSGGTIEKGKWDFERAESGIINRFNAIQLVTLFQRVKKILL